MPSQNVLVIGGGLAGLASAVALAEAGIEVQFVEKRPHLGGRATSYTLPDGTEVDNCQHVTLGCCTNLADFYRRAGAAGRSVSTTGSISWTAMVAGRQWRHRSFHRRCTWPRRSSFLARSRLRTSGQSQGLCSRLRGRGPAAGIESVSMLAWLQRMKQTQGASTLLARRAGQRARRRAGAN